MAAPPSSPALPRLCSCRCHRPLQTGGVRQCRKPSALGSPPDSCPLNGASLSEPCASATRSTRWDAVSFPPGPHSILATPHSGGPRCPRAFSTWTPYPGHTCLPPAGDPGGPATCSLAHHTALPSVGLARESNPALLLSPALGGRKPCIPRPPTWAPQARPAPPHPPPPPPPPARPGPEDPSALPHGAPCPPASQQPLGRALPPLHHRAPPTPSWPPRESCGPELRHLASLSWPQRYSAAPAALRGLHLLHTAHVRRARAPADNHPHTPTHTHATPLAPHVRTHNRSSAPQPRGIAATRRGRESHPPKGLWVRRRVAAQGNGSAQLHLPQMITRAGWGWGSGQAWSGSRLPRATPAGQCLAAALDQGENAGGA